LALWHLARLYVFGIPLICTWLNCTWKPSSFIKDSRLYNHGNISVLPNIHHQYIKLNSKWEKGNTFQFWLPGHRNMRRNAECWWMIKVHPKGISRRFRQRSVDYRISPLKLVILTQISELFFLKGPKQWEHLIKRP
jgi:hypothetical protein